jgi:hypothetical protein
MVDCFDRIAVQMTEIALEPVRLLPQQSMLAAVTMRIASNGRKYAITIEKRFPDGPGNPPTYRWTLTEIDTTGEPIAAPVVSATTFPAPEPAWWSAVSSMCAR